MILQIKKLLTLSFIISFLFSCSSVENDIEEIIILKNSHIDANGDLVVVFEKLPKREYANENEKQAGILILQVSTSQKKELEIKKMKDSKLFDIHRGTAEWKDVVSWFEKYSKQKNINQAISLYNKYLHDRKQRYGKYSGFSSDNKVIQDAVAELTERLTR